MKTTGKKLLALLLSVLILKERIDVMKIAAVLCGAGAILLLING